MAGAEGRARPRTAPVERRPWRRGLAGGEARPETGERAREALQHGVLGKEALAAWFPAAAASRGGVRRQARPAAGMEARGSGGGLGAGGRRQLRAALGRS